MQRNFCLSLLRTEKKEYFANLNEKDITDNRKFGILSNCSFRIKLNLEKIYDLGEQ